MRQRKFRNFVVELETDVSVESDFPKEDIIGRLGGMTRYMAIHVSTSTKKAYIVAVFANPRYENGMKDGIRQWDVKGYDCFNVAAASVPETAVRIHAQGKVPEMGGTIVGFKRKIGEGEEKMGALEQEKEGMAKKIRSLEIKNAGLESMVNNLKKKMQDAAKRQMGEDKEKMSALEREKEDMTKKIRSLEAKNAGLESMVSDLKKKMQDAEKRESGLEKARLEGRVCNLEKKVDDAGKRESELKLKNVGLEKMIGIATRAVGGYIDARFGGNQSWAAKYRLELSTMDLKTYDALTISKMHKILDASKCVGEIAICAIGEYIDSRFGKNEDDEDMDYQWVVQRRSTLSPESLKTYDMLTISKIHEILDPTGTQRMPKDIKNALRIYHPDKVVEWAKLQKREVGAEEYAWMLDIFTVVTQRLNGVPKKSEK